MDGMLIVSRRYGGLLFRAVFYDGSAHEGGGFTVEVYIAGGPAEVSTGWVAADGSVDDDLIDGFLATIAERAASAVIKLNTYLAPTDVESVDEKPISPASQSQPETTRFGGVRTDTGIKHDCEHGENGAG